MNQRGFTLIEMAIVLAIVGLLVGGGLIAIGPVLDQTHSTQTKNNLDQIENALVLFAIRNNRLPCPADGSLANISANSATYGVEGAQVAASATSPAICDITKVPLANSVIPWRTLGIDETYSIDGWNNRISYFVAGGQTGTGWDSLVDPGTTGSGGTVVANTPSSGGVLPSVLLTGNVSYTGAEPPSLLVTGGGSNVVPPVPSDYSPALNFTSTNVATYSLAPNNSGYASLPTVVIGTAGCLFRNGGSTINGRASLCDGALSVAASMTNALSTYLSPSFPYGNYIAVYSLSANPCGNELTSPNFTVVTTVATCSVAATGTNLTTTKTVLQNVQYWGNRAAYVLVSHGKSGWYAWPKGGGAQPFQPSSIVPIKEYNATGSAGQPDNLGFVQSTPQGTIKSPTITFFDDIVRWRSPAMIIQLCGPGACGNP